MASLQEPGLVRMYRKKPSGDQTLITQQRIETMAPAGGAPDAAGASVSTPEKLISIFSSVVLVNDDILLVTFEPDAGGDILDASDSIWIVGIKTPSGDNALGQAQFANPALSDLTLIANEQVVAGYKVTEGSLQVNGKQYLDLQDNT